MGLVVLCKSVKERKLHRCLTHCVWANDVCSHISWVNVAQVLAWWLCSTKPLPESMPEPMNYYQLDPQEQHLWNLNQDTKILIKENAAENAVCKMAAILFWSQCVKQWRCFPFALNHQYSDCLAQDCGNSIDNTLGLQQYRAKPLIQTIYLQSRGTGVTTVGRISLKWQALNRQWKRK